MPKKSKSHNLKSESNRNSHSNCNFNPKLKSSPIPKSKPLLTTLALALAATLIALAIYFIFIKDYQKERLLNLGYSETEIEFFRDTFDEETLKSFETRDFLPYLSGLLETENFSLENLEKYLDYLKNLTPETYALEDIIYIVNNNLTAPYSENLVALIHTKFFIPARTDRYLAYLEQLQPTEPAAQPQTSEAPETSETSETPETPETQSPTAQEPSDPRFRTSVEFVNANLDKTAYDDSEPTDLSQSLPIINKYYSVSKDFKPENLVKIDAKYDNYGDGYLEPTTYEAFKSLVDAAEKEGLHIRNNSAYRSFSDQQGIYNNYLAAGGTAYAESYAAHPGFSEHHTGLALDVGVPLSMVVSRFEFTKEFAWLKDHAHEFGFILRYPEDKTTLTGYNYEPWHYRYVGLDAAKFIYENNITFEEYYAYAIIKL